MNREYFEDLIKYIVVFMIYDYFNAPYEYYLDLISEMYIVVWENVNDVTVLLTVDL